MKKNVNKTLVSLVFQTRRVKKCLGTVRSFFLLGAFTFAASAANAELSDTVQYSLLPDGCAKFKTTFSQNKVAENVVYGFLGLEPSRLLQVVVSDYQAWKNMESSPYPSGCVRDVEEILNLEVQYLQPRSDGSVSRCSKKFVVRTYKDYAASETWIAPRKYWEVCNPETPQQAEQRRTCQQEVTCLSRKRRSTYANILADCECQLATDFFLIPNVQSAYEDFFEDGQHEQAPEGLGSFEEFKASPVNWFPQQN